MYEVSGIGPTVRPIIFATPCPDPQSSFVATLTPGLVLDQTAAECSGSRLGEPKIKNAKKTMIPQGGEISKISESPEIQMFCSAKIVIAAPRFFAHGKPVPRSGGILATLTSGLSFGHAVHRHSSFEL